MISRLCRRKLPRRSVSCLLVVLSCGCGGPREDLPPTAPVNGKIIFRGVPLDRGMIAFFPDDGQKPGVGAINEDGTFSLTTFEKGDGAIIGDHTATIEAYEDDPAGGQSMNSLVPTKYTDLIRSPLKYVVKEGEENIIDIVIED